MNEFWRANDYALEELERERRRETSPENVGDQVGDTCKKISHSVDKSGTDPVKVIKVDEMVFVGAVLLIKFCLWFLYRFARDNEIDVSGI